MGENSCRIVQSRVQISCVLFLFCQAQKKKGKFVPVRSTTGYRGRRVIAPFIPSLRAVWKSVGKVMSRSP